MAARRQEASRLEALRELLRWREEECNKENKRHDNETLHHGVTKETEGQQRGKDREDNGSRANSNKEAEPVIGDNVNKTIGIRIGINKGRAKTGRRGKDHARMSGKTHNRTDIGDDGEEGQERQEGDGGKDIQAGEELEEGHHGANGNVPTNDPHHSTHGAPSEGQDEGEQKRQVVDGGKDIQAREELEEGHHGTNVPTGEEGEGDKQGTRARGGGGGGDGEMKGSPP